MGDRERQHPGRSRDPDHQSSRHCRVEFETSDLVRAEAFSRAFGFAPRFAAPTSCIFAASIRAHPAC
jgi:hypothetical protein